MEVMSKSPTTITTTTLLKNRPFLCLWGAQVLTQLGTNMLSFVLALRVFRLTQSNLAVGLLLLTVGLATLLFGALAGVLVDHWEKKKVLLAANFFRFLLLVLFIFAGQALWLIVAFAFVFTVVTQFFIPAEGAVIPQLVESESLLAANSLFTFTLYGSIILGFVGSGPALKLFGPHGVFFFMASFFLFATFLVSFLPPHLFLFNQVFGGFRRAFLPRLNGSFSGVSFVFVPWRRFGRLGVVLGELGEGFGFIRGNFKVLESILLLAFSQVIVAVLLALSPGFAHEVLKIEIEDASLVIMLPAAVGMILGSLFLARFGSFWPRRFLRYFGLFSLGVILLFLFFVQNLAFLLPFSVFLVFLLGISNSLVAVPAQTILQEETGFNMRGRVFGVLSASVSAASALPVVAAGFLADLIGVGGVLLLTGAGVLVVAAALRLREIRYNIN